MHKMILDETIAKVRQRESEGDCPVTPAYSIEHLENALLTLAGKVEASGSEREGESVAIMRPFWVSWWGEPGTFELHRPWWISGERDDGKPSICAAVLAQDEFTARLSVQWAHNDKDAIIEWRFSEEKPKGWSPFGDRFRQADWMIWPEVVRPQPSWSEEVQTADTTHSRRLFFGDPGSPQPSGETREIAWKILEEIPAINDLGSQFQEDIQAAIVTALEYSRPAPVASGGQHSGGEGESDLCRVEKAITAQPGVKKCIAHGDISVRQIANAVLRVMGARPAPVAETAGEAVAWRYQWTPHRHEQWSGWEVSIEDPRITGPRRYRSVHPLYTAPVPAQDDDKLRIAVEALDAAYRRWVVEAGESNDVLQCVGPVIAALKSTAAQEGGA